VGRYQGHSRSTGRIHDAAFAHILQFRAQRICKLIQITDSVRWHDAIT
jgi:ketosteroid isomerase-like protein